ncbi:hypothetical protein QQY66_27660 [Streptomyces sp. DG2A-72]|uniref:hypothetical protein n=1 Tax=Streptomyces sp. DG2A-72 TaxID=3051386 RepID=UPI00265C4DB8|nr:hypothetical protein [Streptomyces sp. DG2A-72]MDO0935259.1 hypothetical protein [Streptomyces sp. DG2A-72]
MSASSPFPRWSAGGALLLALLVAGCGSASDGDTSDSAASGKGRADDRTPSAEPTPTPTPTPTLTASDGTRYSACADGTCEVAISRPVEFAVNGSMFNVTKVNRGNSLEFKLALSYGARGSGTLAANCGVTRFMPGRLSTERCTDDNRSQKPPAPQAGTLALQMAGWDADNAAVVRLVSG